MPIYEYRCPNGHVFELFQRMADAQPERCEVCEVGPLVRVLYPVAVHFKGSGFYATDYGRSSRKGGAKDGDSGSGSGSDGGSGSDSDSGSDSPGKTVEKKAAEA
ncbi:MAG: zinc ribbon domain-containing protein [Actinobacteria bacterium]|nr:zinc ribbon domain-containing protein [Actinomycetota bacterium]